MKKPSFMRLNLHQKKLSVLSCLFLAAMLAGCTKHEHVITSFADAKHAKIGIMIGTTGEALAIQRFPDAQVQSYDDIMDAMAAMKSGQLDAVITTSVTALQVIKKNPEFRLLKEQLNSESNSIAVKKGDDKLLAAVDNIISELRADGTLADMNKRWFKEGLSDYEEKKIEPPLEGKVLKIGVTATREPINFVDKNGRVTGFDAELARIIGVRLHRPVAFLNMKFMALISALQSGKVDLIITGMSSTPERKKSVNFTQPYFFYGQVMIVRAPQKRVNGRNGFNATKNEQAPISSVDDLKEKRIGVLLGSVHDAYATKTYPNATILQYSNPSDIILAVKTGKVDAAIYTHETLLYILRANNDLGMLAPPLLSIPIGMGFNKQNNALREQFNQFLKEIKQNGVFDDMINRWITRGDITMPTIQNNKTNGVLTVGIVSDKGLPFCILKNNKLIGFDIELSERFAAYLGKELKLSDMEFGSLIAAVSTNKIDMISSTLMITEERKKKINFSDGYYELRASAFALRKNIAAYGIASAKQDSSFSAPTLFSGILKSLQSNIIQENRWQLILDGLRTTVIISTLATLFGTALGALVCFMRMSKKRLLILPAKLYISILRGTPVLVFLMLIFYVVFASVNIDPVLVAVIAFGMNFGAYAAEIFRTGIEGVDHGQTEAGIALGFSKVKTFLFIVLPQTVRRILPVYKGEVISLVKMTSIVGYIAVQDLTKASDIIRSRTFDAFFPLIMVAILYFLISWVLLFILDYFERLSDPKSRKKPVTAS